MKFITNIEEFHKLAAEDKKFCAIFSADWCPDCQVLKPVLPGLEDEFRDRYTFALVDWDAYLDLAKKFDVIGIPSFVVFRQGEVIGTYISEERKTRQQIADFLEET